MKLYIKASEDNKLPVDPELEDIFYKLENNIRTYVVSCVNDKLNNKLGLVEDAFYHSKRSNHFIDYDEEGRPYIDSYTASKASSDIRMRNSHFIDVPFGQDEYAEVNAFLSTGSPRGLIIQIWKFPLTRNFSCSEYVLEPDFIENTCKKLVDGIIGLCNTFVSVSKNKSNYNF